MHLRPLLVWMRPQEFQTPLLCRAHMQSKAPGPGGTFRITSNFTACLSAWEQFWGLGVNSHFSHDIQESIPKSHCSLSLHDIGFQAHTSSGQRIPHCHSKPTQFKSLQCIKSRGTLITLEFSLLMFNSNVGITLVRGNVNVTLELSWKD